MKKSGERTGVVAICTRGGSEKDSPPIPAAPPALAWLSPPRWRAKVLRATINGRSQSSMEDVVAQLHSMGLGDVQGFAGALSTATAAEELARRHPTLEILVNNSAFSSFEEISMRTGGDSSMWAAWASYECVLCCRRALRVSSSKWTIGVRKETQSSLKDARKWLEEGTLINFPYVTGGTLMDYQTRGASMSLAKKRGVSRTFGTVLHNKSLNGSV